MKVGVNYLVQYFFHNVKYSVNTFLLERIVLFLPKLKFGFVIIGFNHKLKKQCLEMDFTVKEFRVIYWTNTQVYFVQMFIFLGFFL